MIKNLIRTLSPSAPELMEKADFLPALAINTDHGHPLSHIVMDLASDVTKLKVAIPWIGRISQARLQGLEVHSRRKRLAFQQPAYGVARNLNPCTLQLLSNFVYGFVGSFAPTHRISSSFVFHNRCNRLYDLGRFFPVPGNCTFCSNPVMGQLPAHRLLAAPCNGMWVHAQKRSDVCVSTMAKF